MIRLIVAVDRKNGMAKHGGQPWYIPHDEKYFTEKTKSYGGKNVIGRITFQTFKGPLAGRTNYVLTSNEEDIEGAIQVHDLKTFLEQNKGEDLWIVGGAHVFQQVIDMGFADELYITHIDADFGCDQFFPEYSKTFTQTKVSDWHEENGFKFKYAIYSRAT